MSSHNVTHANRSNLFSAVGEQVSWAILTLMSLYLVAVLTNFELRHGKRSDKGINEKQRRQKMWIYLFGENPMCLAAAAFSLLRCAILQVELSLGARSNAACAAFHFLNTALNNLNILAVYITLWTRQRTLYKNMALKYLFTTPLRFLNMCVIVTFLVAMAVVTSLVYAGLGLVTSPIGCVYVAMDDVIRMAIMAMSFVSTVAIQICMLVLVLYPLIRHYGLGGSCGRRKSRGGRIRAVVIRLSISTAVCVISDVILGLGVSIYDAMVHDRSVITWLVYNLNMVLNTVALVCSFKDWPVRLFPWKRPRRERRSGADTGNSVDRTELASRVTMATGKQHDVTDMST